jgi:hypothetical protein
VRAQVWAWSCASLTCFLCTPEPHGTTGSSIPDDHVRWMYVVENIRWALQLGDSKGQLQPVLVDDLSNHERPMADSWGNFSDWSRSPVHFEAASSCTDELLDNGPWHDGLRVDENACTSMCMEQRFVNMLQFWVRFIARFYSQFRCLER